MSFHQGKCLLLERLKEARISQNELADKVDLPRQRINDYAHGRKLMSASTMYTISKAIGCRMESLYEWINHQQPTDQRSGYE